MVSYSRVRTRPGGRAAVCRRGNVHLSGDSWARPVARCGGRGPVGRDAHERGRRVSSTRTAAVASLFVLTAFMAAARPSLRGGGRRRRRGRRRPAARRARRGRSPRAPSRRPRARKPAEPADAHADAHEVGRPEALDDAPQAVVARVAAAHLEADVLPRQVELVVDDDDVRTARPSGTPPRAARSRPTGSCTSAASGARRAAPASSPRVQQPVNFAL